MSWGHGHSHASDGGHKQPEPEVFELNPSFLLGEYEERARVLQMQNFDLSSELAKARAAVTQLLQQNAASVQTVKELQEALATYQVGEDQNMNTL